MMNNPKISVITPTRDREEKLEQVRECLKNQTVKPIMWSVVDDSRSALPDKFFTDLPFPHRYTHLKRTLPISIAYNSALALDLCPRSDIYVIFEDDDYYPPTYIENAISFFSSDADELVGNRRWPDYRLTDPSYRVRMTNPTGKQGGLAEWHHTLIKGHDLCMRIVSFGRGRPAARSFDCDLRDYLVRCGVRYTLFDFGEEHSCISLKGYGGGGGVIDAHRSSEGFTPDTDYVMLKKWLGEDIHRYQKFLRVPLK